MAKSRKAKAKRKTRSSVSKEISDISEVSPARVPTPDVQPSDIRNTLPKVVPNEENSKSDIVPDVSEMSSESTFDSSVSEISRTDAPACKTIITVGSINPRIYDGSGDIDEWLDHFNYIAKCNHWNEALQLSRIPVYLKGTAELWFSDFSRLAAESLEKLSMDLVFNGLREAFRHKNFRSMNQSQLICRVQGLNEPIHQYYYDMMRLCHRVNPLMAESEKLTHIMRGLKSTILEKVLVLEPKDCKDLLSKSKSVEEAEYLANSRPSYNYFLLQDRDKLDENSQNQSPNQSLSQSQTNPQSTNNPNEMQELCNALKAIIGRIGSRYQQRKPWQNGNRNDQRRPSRTIDGRPVCYTCNIAGHYSTSCPLNTNPNVAAIQAPNSLPAITQTDTANVGPNSGNQQ